jgi:cytochrome c-type biogenesis protein CcsB
MRMMAIAMFVFFVAIGGATLLESTYDTQTSKLFIYNAMWFNLLLTYLALNLIANIMRHRMIENRKWAVLLFHVSFIVILIGAGVTRFVSFEGMMVIGEGEKTNFMYSSSPHVSYRITDKVQQLTNDYPLYLSELDAWNDFELSEEFPGRKGEISIEYLDYHKNMIDSLVTNDSISESSIELNHLGESRYIPENGFLTLDNVAFSFDKNNAMPGVEFFKKGNDIKMKVMMPGGTSLPMATLQKSDRTTGVPDSLYQPIPMDTLVTLETSILYKVGQAQFVFKGLKKHTKMVRLKSTVKDEGLDDLIVKVAHGKKSKVITLTGGSNSLPSPTMFELNGLFYDMTYGPKIIEIPFEVGCNDFRLDRYPGSNVASSYESDLEIIDEANNYNHKQTVFMNNVMDYQGYRFFQSSYFPDEKGTKLSVNYDRLGTNITYIGYLLMALGMVLSLFMKNGRMRDLVRKLEKSHDRRVKIQNTTLAIALLFSMSAFGQTTEVEDHSGHDHSTEDHSGHDHSKMEGPISDENNIPILDSKGNPVLDSNGVPVMVTSKGKPQIEPQVRKVSTHKVMSKEVSDEVASLLIYDFRGRIIPFHTFADQLMRKVRRDNTYNDYNAVQTVMSMHMYPDYWLRQDLIYIDSKGGIRDRFEGRKYVSLIDLTDTLTGNFIFLEEYEAAHQKKESKRGEFEKKLLKIAERFSVVNDVATWRLMKLIPSKTDPIRAWYIPLSPELAGADTLGSQLALRFFTSLDRSVKTNSDTEAFSLLKELKEYQRAIAGKDSPTISDVDMEVRYNKMNIFHNTASIYGLIGFVLLMVFFFGIFIRPTARSKKMMKYIGLSLIGVLVLTFLYHGYGIYMRAMITGYAPWSSGYEAIVFIGFVTMFAGFFLYRKYPVVTAGAAILGFLMLFVADMNLLDPEITPMQPVLKSYWLMIHVAIITGSYAPLGIACVLSFLALVLYAFRNQKNATVLNININELTYISEIFMTIGVFMLTIGTFLGGVWANESWGRYWGWDPKETWALVAVLVYAIILHVRYIPGLKGKFIFNVLGFWGYTSILFTFFGVNFYLVGLHSYAQGEGLAEIPMWIKVTFLVLGLFTVFVGLRNRNFKKKLKQDDIEL